MNEDSIAVHHFHEPVAQKIRKKAYGVLYYLKTGYWHTGERVHPLFVTNNFINHLRTYQYVSQFTKDAEVLDVGCGTGYGSSFLGRNAARVVGIDLSKAAINEAFRLHPEGEFIQMDAEVLHFPDQSFDVIISTENLEHLPHQEKHLRELARVVRKGGTCFIATPNPELSIGTVNPFHFKENTYSELLDLLSQHFREVEIVEPMRVPSNLLGLQARNARFSHGENGKIVGSG